MNNEIGRKITSLTLMTIMLAGGMTIAAPGFMPAAFAANANLFVSAENSQFDNYMSGPQVIEVVVIDSDINDTDEAKGEPDVTVNGKTLRMVQAVDGNWYGYFADKNMATIADYTSQTAGVGLDFGLFCDQNFQSTIGGNSTVTFTDTVGIALPQSNLGLATAVNGTGLTGQVLPTCTNYTTQAADVDNHNNVVREAKASTTPSAAGVSDGQIGVTPAMWPFVQLYSLNPTGNVVVQYNKGGGAQSTTLTFDTVDNFASASLDRAVYPQGAEVHATLTDLWLNVDPTDEDSWTFGTVSTITTNYQVFNENGLAVGNYTTNTDSNRLNATALSTLMCEDNCIMEFNPDVQGKGDVATLQDNDDSVLITTSADPDLQNPIAFGVPVGSVGGAVLNATVPITFTEQGPNSGVFGSYDESDTSNIKITDAAARGTSASITYNEDSVSILVGHSYGSVDIQPSDDEWNSGEEIPVIIVDGDANRNSRADEDLDLFNANAKLIPSLVTGDPFTLAEDKNVDESPLNAIIMVNASGSITNGTGKTINLVGATNATLDIKVDRFSKRAIGTANETLSGNTVLVIDLGTTAEQLKQTVKDHSTTGDFKGFNLFNLDTRSFGNSAVDVFIINATDGTAIIGSNGLIPTGLNYFSIVNATAAQSLKNLSTNATVNSLVEQRIIGMTDSNELGLLLQFDTAVNVDITEKEAFVADFFSFGFTDDGLEDNQRIANQLIRIEAEETGDNTSTFEGSLEYVMLNQLNILDASTYTSLSPIADDPSFIVIEDLDDEESPRVNYLDLGADGVKTQVADQEEAPSHSGIVSFDSDSYKEADTVTITLEDLDLNVDSDLIDIYTVVSTDTHGLYDIVGDSDNTITFSTGEELGRLLDITFDDEPWVKSTIFVDIDGDNTNDSTEKCSSTPISSDGLGATGFTLVETGPETGIFIGDFQVPFDYCSRAGNDAGSIVSVTGLDIEVNYVDFRDASGEFIEVGDSAGIRATTGSVSLDRTVYPVPFGVPSNFVGGSAENDSTPTGRSVFPIHQTGVSGALGTGEFLANGDLTIHVRVNDPDFDVSASGEDLIGQNTTGTGVGPVKISVIRGADSVILGYAGGDTKLDGKIGVGSSDAKAVRQFGPIDEIAPDAGIFEADIVVRYTDGPADSQCPVTTDFTPLDGTSPSLTNPDTSRFAVTAPTGEEYCILQGDILQVEYTDPADASGDVNTVTDSATFDLRNGVLQSDKSVYIIGSDMILTLIEPDFDLDNDQAETRDLDLIEWDSDAATVTMGDKGGEASAFDPEPLSFRETGDSTGIFQIVIEIPETLAGDNLERGEEIILEYTDWGPSGSDYVGDEDEDVNLTIFTSNFGATVELDQKVYTWTDKVYITIVAPDHNFDGDLVDEIGDTDLDPIKISTRGHDIDNYKLVETGTDTGIFTGEVILTGFLHDADGKDGDDTNPRTSADGSGPTDGYLQTDDDDGLTVSFEFSEDETVVGSSLIRWNIGEVQWLEASYPASGTGVVRVIDPDMNLDPEAVDNFDVDVWSDSDAGGIDLTVTETNEATGIFEGTVFFTVSDESSGHRLRVAEGDTVTAEYEDNTLPDPYTTADELDITATSLIGTVVPPLERAPAANLRTVDAFGNSLDTVAVDQQVQISADLANGQDREQTFAYLVQIQDGNGVTVSLAWITGSLSAGQSFSPALSWIPTQSGSYTATAFVWESVDNPTALSPPVSTTITVQ
ncbi:MAG: hypothetical protein K5777_08045 [Nitrosopumilus sp.]|nr:hypothetical protein [Nitrosopumilus sp.]